MLIKKDPYCVNMRMPILTEVEKIKKKEENDKQTKEKEKLKRK